MAHVASRALFCGARGWHLYRRGGYERKDYASPLTELAGCQLIHRVREVGVAGAGSGFSQVGAPVRSAGPGLSRRPHAGRKDNVPQ